MKFFLFSLLLFVISCKSEYSGLTAIPADVKCIDKYGRKLFKTSWYAASVDVYGRHLSGLLLIKQLDDGTFRTVLTNEAGVSFFDFEFTKEGGFRVKRIIKQLDKKPVINILREDFSLLLGLPFENEKLQSFKRENEVLHGVTAGSESAYFVTDLSCETLKRLEMGSRRKKKVSIELTGNRYSPDVMQIRHHTFDMVIDLKKIEKE